MRAFEIALLNACIWVAGISCAVVLLVALDHLWGLM